MKQCDLKHIAFLLALMPKPVMVKSYVSLEKKFFFFFITDRAVYASLKVGIYF